MYTGAPAFASCLRHLFDVNVQICYVNFPKICRICEPRPFFHYCINKFRIHVSEATSNWPASEYWLHTHAFLELLAVLLGKLPLEGLSSELITFLTKEVESILLTMNFLHKSVIESGRGLESVSGVVIPSKKLCSVPWNS